MTALVPSETACFASSPGRISLTLFVMLEMYAMKKRGCGNTYDVWISRDEMVDFLLYAASLDASVATRSKISKNWNQYAIVMRWMDGDESLPLTKELRMDMARLEIPVSGWTCFKTRKWYVS